MHFYQTQRSLFYLASRLLWRAPLARYHSLRSLGDDLYYVAQYGRGRHRVSDGWAWTYHGAARKPLPWFEPAHLYRRDESGC